MTSEENLDKKDGVGIRVQAKPELTVLEASKLFNTNSNKDLNLLQE